MSVTAISATSCNGTPYTALDDFDDDFPDPEVAQSISGRNIDATKLSTLLRMKFGAGTYDIHIMQNSYCIIAPRKLSLVEIARCRKR